MAKNLSELLVKEIKEHILSYKQWKEDDHFNTAAKYGHQLEGLVELAEIKLCGSVGGFDKGQLSSNLMERAAWIIKNKHRLENDV